MREPLDTVVATPAADQLMPDVAQVSRAMGYPVDACTSFSEMLQSMIESHLVDARSMIHPAYVYRLASIEQHAGGVMTVSAAGRSADFHFGSIIDGQLHNSAALAVFVVTVGDELEEAARACMRSEQILEGYLFDAIGSVAAEIAAEAMHAAVTRHAADQQWRVTNRFSPGYCDWATAEQARLFAFLDDVDLPVKLTASQVMRPMKSVSGIIGLGPDVQRAPYPCAVCQQEECHARMDAHALSPAPSP